MSISNQSKRGFSKVHVVTSHSLLNRMLLSKGDAHVFAEQRRAKTNHSS